MWISKKKWDSLEKRVADLEIYSKKSQQSENKIKDVINEIIESYNFTGKKISGKL